MIELIDGFAFCPPQVDAMNPLLVVAGEKLSFGFSIFETNQLC